MSEFKGTKGKWEKVTANWDLDQCVFIEDTEEKICDVKSLPHNAIYDALLISKAPEMLEALERILYMSEERGRSGCTYGDTEMSSIDVTFGYNLALENVKSGLADLIKQATEI